MSQLQDMVKRMGRELSFSMLVGFTWKLGEKDSKPVSKSEQALKYWTIPI